MLSTKKAIKKKKRKKKERKRVLNQESDQEERKHALDQERDQECVQEKKKVFKLKIIIFPRINIERLTLNQMDNYEVN